MDKDLESAKLIDNTADNQFEISIDAEIAFIEYIIKDDKIVLTHTEVPDAFQGRGVASILVHKVLVHVKSNDRTVVPQCSFVAAYIKERPEWHSLLAENE